MTCVTCHLLPWKWPDAVAKAHAGRAKTDDISRRCDESRAAGPTPGATGAPSDTGRAAPCPTTAAGGSAARTASSTATNARASGATLAAGSATRAAASTFSARPGAAVDRREAL
jgi:hypothetical protein